ncbi:hypothetical protein ABT324_23355 [Saccharopolyspora sp. NPDC000359]|uniref:hypothetical protein n=1 Tax=Saccharopolyspora sp. NPDC000359 TaxID=3154251 RepID=UPI00333020DC
MVLIAFVISILFGGGAGALAAFLIVRSKNKAQQQAVVGYPQQQGFAQQPQQFPQQGFPQQPQQGFGQPPQGLYPPQ